MHTDTNLGKVEVTLRTVSYAWWKMGEVLEIMGLLTQVYLTNDLMNWAEWLNYFCVLIVIEWFLAWPPIYSLSLTFILYWFFPYASQSSQIISVNFIIKFLKNMIKLTSFWKGFKKSVLFICPTLCLPACLSVTHFSQDLLSRCS